MDIITQGLLGATVAVACAKPEEARKASIVGFFAPLLADADALIGSAEDPLLYLEYHRHFTHALLFIPFGALVASLLLWPFFKNRLAINKVYLFALLGYGTAGLLDACTSYGTHLLWPFSDERLAWNIISIFDPFFSLVLIFVLVVATVKYKPQAGRVGIVFVLAYLAVGAIMHNRAESLALQNAQQRGHRVSHLIVKPTLGNLLLWRAVYKADEKYYIDALRLGLPGNTRVFPGNAVQAFDIKRDLPELTTQTRIYRDVERFGVFSDGYLAWHPDYKNVLGDVRYSMLPTDTRPLWGIALNLDNPDEPVRFETYRTMTDAQRKAFISMLLN